MEQSRFRKVVLPLLIYFFPPVQTIFSSRAAVPPRPREPSRGRPKREKGPGRGKKFRFYSLFCLGQQVN